MHKPLMRNPLLHLAATMWRHAGEQRPWVLLYMAMSLSSVVVSLCGPLIIARLMNAVQNNRGEALVAGAVSPLVLFFLVGLGFWLLHGPSRVMENRVAFLLKARYVAVLFRSVTGLPMKWQREHHSGETIDQVTKAGQALSEFAESGFEVIHMLTRFAGALVILGLFMPLAALAVAAVTVAVVLTIVLFDRVLIEQYQTLNKRFNAVAALVQDFLTNVSTVISLRLEERAGREVVERTMAIFPLARKNARTNELKWFCTSMLIRATQVGVLFGYVLVAARSEGAIEIGTFYALFEYLGAIGDSFLQFTWKYGDLVVKSTRVQAVEHIQEAYDVLVRPDEEARLPDRWQRVDVRNLNFSQNPAQNQELQLAAVDLSLRPGRFIALVGESGSGKSTALGCLRGIHNTPAVSVLCDGQELRHKLAHIGHHCTLIPQEPEIFAESAWFNVTLGIETSEEAVLRAIRLARFDRVLARLPHGLATNVAEKGINLSGGEKQRLALARGLFFVEESGSQIVLMDEPTSSVDQLNEWLIYEGIRAHFADRCVVSALHKLSLLALFDEVLVFSHGRVVERGTLQELLALNGELARMWSCHERAAEIRTVAC